MPAGCVQLALSVTSPFPPCPPCPSSLAFRGHFGDTYQIHRGPPRRWADEISTCPRRRRTRRTREKKGGHGDCANDICPAPSALGSHEGRAARAGLPRLCARAALPLMHHHEGGERIDEPG